MKEITVTLRLKELKEKVKNYVKSTKGGYYFEIFFASNRVQSKPFKVHNGK
jgi:hypothetical protein